MIGDQPAPEWPDRLEPTELGHRYTDILRAGIRRNPVKGQQPIISAEATGILDVLEQMEGPERADVFSALALGAVNRAWRAHPGVPWVLSSQDPVGALIATVLNYGYWSDPEGLEVAVSQAPAESLRRAAVWLVLHP